MAIVPDNYDTYDLPSFIVGTSRKQPQPFRIVEPLFGPPLFEATSVSINDLPVAWDIRVILKKDQVALFDQFLDNIKPLGYKFYKSVVTECGKNLHHLQIVGNRPQPRQVASNTWTYSFTVYAENLDRTKTYDSEVEEIQPAQTQQTLIPSWERYGLPDFLLGPVRTRIDLEDKRNVFDGPFEKKILTIDEPVYWDAEISCNSLQAKRFDDFVQEIVGTYAGFFTKLIKTENGVKEQLVRIVSGIPQGKQVRANVWRFKFTILARSFNDVDDLLGGLPDDGYYPEKYKYLPRYWVTNNGAVVADIPPAETKRVFVSKDANTVMVAGGNIKVKAAISVNNGDSWRKLSDDLGVPEIISESSKTVVAMYSTDDRSRMYVALNIGYILVSRNGGATWSILNERFLQSGVPPSSTMTSVSFANSGMVIFACFDSGVAAVSTNGGLSFTPLTQGLGKGGLPQTRINCSAISDDGTFIVVGFDDGYITKSTNTGATFLPAGQALSTSMIYQPVRSIACSESGSFIVAGMDSGYCSISLNSGVSWLEQTRGLGHAPTYPQFISAGTSDDGRVSVLGDGTGLASMVYTNDGAIYAIEKLQPGLVKNQNTRSITSIWNGGRTWFASRGEGDLSMSSPRYKNPSLPRDPDESDFSEEGGGGTPTVPDYTNTPRAPVGVWTRFTLNWANPSNQFDDPIESSISNDGSRILYISNRAQFIKSENAGATWTPFQTLYTAAGSPTTSTTDGSIDYEGVKAFIIFSTGQAVVTEDSGNTWAALTPGLNSGVPLGGLGASTFAGIATNANASRTFAAFSGGYASMTEGSLFNFTPLTRFASATAGVILGGVVNAIMSGDGRKISVTYSNAAGSSLSGNITFVSSDSGLSWTELPQGFGTGTGQVTYSIIGMNHFGDVAMASSSSGSILMSTDNMATWQVVTATGISNFSSRALDVAIAGDIILLVAVGGRGSISTNRGLTWSEVARTDFNYETNFRNITTVTTNYTSWVVGANTLDGSINRL